MVFSLQGIPHPENSGAPGHEQDSCSDTQEVRAEARYIPCITCQLFTDSQLANTCYKHKVLGSVALKAAGNAQVCHRCSSE